MPTNYQLNDNSYDSDTESESQAGSPVKSRKNKINGKAPTGSPKKSMSGSNRTQVSKEGETVNETTSHNGDSNEGDGDEENAASVDVSLVIF